MSIVAVEAARGTADPLDGARRTRVSPVKSTSSRVPEAIASRTPVAVELMTVAELEQVVASASGKPCSITNDPDAWFPALGNQPYTLERDAEQQREAQRLCAGCPVKAACLRWSLEDPRGEFGVWGGESEWTRRRMRKQLLQSRAVASSEVRATGQLAGVQL